MVTSRRNDLWPAARTILACAAAGCGILGSPCRAETGEGWPRLTLAGGSGAEPLAAARAAAGTEVGRWLDEPFRPSPSDLEQPSDQPPVGAGTDASGVDQHAAGGGAGNAQNDANSPLTPKLTFNLHNYYIPSYYGLNDRDSDQFLLRGVLPHKLAGAPQLFRFTLPIANVPTFPDGSDTGLGDLTLIDYFMFKEAGLQLGIGPVLVLPTASTESLGAGKWQAGASGVIVAPQEWGLLGGILTFQQSFASQGGDSDRDQYSLLQFQPLAIFNLPHGFYLRSSAIWNFDLNQGTYYIPAGFGAGYVFEAGAVTINAFVEPQYTLFHDGVAPQWQIFAGINFQIAF